MYERARLPGAAPVAATSPTDCAKTERTTAITVGRKLNRVEHAAAAATKALALPPDRLSERHAQMMRGGRLHQSADALLPLR